MAKIGGSAPVVRKKEDRVLTGRQPWELRSCELVFASVEVLHSVAAGPRRCLRCLLLVMCTYSIAKEALMLHLARGEGREHYFGCNLVQRKVLASSHQHLMAEAPFWLKL